MRTSDGWVYAGKAPRYAETTRTVQHNAGWRQPIRNHSRRTTTENPDQPTGSPKKRSCGTYSRRSMRCHQEAPSTAPHTSWAATPATARTTRAGRMHRSGSRTGVTSRRRCRRTTSTASLMTLASSGKAGDGKSSNAMVTRSRTASATRPMTRSFRSPLPTPRIIRRASSAGHRATPETCDRMTSRAIHR